MRETDIWREFDDFEPIVPRPCCPRCDSELTFHQPDEGLPQRLLAICSECGGWFLAAPKWLRFIPLEDSADGRDASDDLGLPRTSP